MRLALGAHEFHGPTDFGFIDPCALHAQRLGLPHRQEECIALSDQRLRTGGIENDSRIGGG